MTAAQARAQLSMWAMVAAPLVLGSDPRALSAQSIAMLTNPGVIAVDQDPLGAQGTATVKQGSAQVWAKRLLGGARAVALLNRGPSAQRISASPAAMRLSPGGAFAVQDLWAATASAATGTIDALVPATGAGLYRVTPLDTVAAVRGAAGHMYVLAPQLASGWQNLGGQIAAAPAVVREAPGAPGSNSQPLFVAVGGDHELLGARAFRRLAEAGCVLLRRQPCGSHRGFDPVRGLRGLRSRAVVWQRPAVARRVALDRQLYVVRRAAIGWTGDRRRRRGVELLYHRHRPPAPHPNAGEPLHRIQPYLLWAPGRRHDVECEHNLCRL
jgi:hypothetical protein